MRWLDYLVCIYCAYYIQIGIFTGDILTLIIGIVAYIVWEKSALKGEHNKWD